MKGIYFIILLGTIGCSQQRAKHTPETELDAYFKKQCPADEPGIAVLISRHDTVLFSQGYGLADLVTKTPITTSTLFNLGSISKTFVANAILMLQAQGKLSVNDNLEHYFPDFKIKSIAQRIKIRHLLTHTSGLPDNRKIRQDSVFYLTAKDRENWHAVMQNDTMLFAPGSRFEYSNPAYNGLALIVEQLAGMKWQKFVTDSIMLPSGMTHSTITDGPHPQQGVAHGYIRVQGKWLEKDYGEEPTFPAAGNGGVWSSVEELELYEKALQKGTFLTLSAIKESRTVYRPENWSDTVPPRVGWSWFTGATENGLLTIGHTGTQGGFLCNYMIVPAAGLHIFILCNSPRDLDTITRDVLAMVTKEKLHSKFYW